MNPFFIFALPRSRTAWLSVFLTSTHSFCYHEALCQCNRIAHLKQLLLRAETPAAGNSDSGNIIFRETILENFPDARIVIVLRDPKAVHKSLALAGVEMDEDAVDGFYKDLLVLAKEYEDSALVVDYRDLDNLDTLATIWEFCVGDVEPFNPYRAHALLQLNIQVDDLAQSFTDAAPNIAALLKEEQ
jgi:hypothetical protein